MLKNYNPIFKVELVRDNDLVIAISATYPRVIHQKGIMAGIVGGLTGNPYGPAHHLNYQRVFVFNLQSGELVLFETTKEDAIAKRVMFDGEKLNLKGFKMRDGKKVLKITPFETVDSFQFRGFGSKKYATYRDKSIEYGGSWDIISYDSKDAKHVTMMRTHGSKMQTVALQAKLNLALEYAQLVASTFSDFLDNKAAIPDAELRAFLKESPPNFEWAE